MGIRTLLFGKSNKNNNTTNKSVSKPNPNLKTSSYDAARELDPPVRGSYPVAGNGPSVLEEIQRSRARKDTQRLAFARPPSIAIAPSITKQHHFSVEFERPRTAPPNGGSIEAVRDAPGRTRSGFTMKAPPPLLRSRRNSSRDMSILPSPIPEDPLSPREIRTYQPRKASAPVAPLAPAPEINMHNGFNGFEPPPIPPFAHNRSESLTSHKSYVDILDAHSTIRPSRETCRHRAQASGVRNYGEDVADRNIAEHGGTPFNLDLAEFSYLRSFYLATKGNAYRDPRQPSPVTNGLGLGSPFTSDDILDLQPPLRNHIRVSSARSMTSSPQPSVILPPPRVDSVQSSAATPKGRDDVYLTMTNGVQKASSPLSSSIYEESPAPCPPIAFHIPRVASPPQVSQNRTPPGRQRKGSTTSIRSGSSTGSRSGSVSYSVFPNMSSPTSSPGSPDTRTTPTTNSHQVNGSSSASARMAITGSKEPISLEGFVDLRNTVDKDVTTKTLPAVTHETVIPTRHEIREERITREVHTHDIFHRILPVIETEILPPKHYIPSAGGRGLVEIPESMVPGRTSTGSASRNWKIVETGMGRGDHGAQLHHLGHPSTANNSIYSHTNEGSDDGAEPPVIGLVRSGEPSSSRARADSLLSMKSTRTSSMIRRAMEPILTSKKETISKDGVPKTEYVWRHPPVFETANGKTYPMYIGTGLETFNPLPQSTASRSSEESKYSEDSEVLAGANYGAIASPTGREENLMFRDSEYGSNGTSMLPGLRMGTPGQSDVPRSSGDDFDDKIRLGRVLDNAFGIETNQEGQATKGLRRIRDRRSPDTERRSLEKEKGREWEIRKIEGGLGRLDI